jgi:hypothetical protein
MRSEVMSRVGSHGAAQMTLLYRYGYGYGYGYRYG